jgi:hypothetical protein
MSDAQRQEPRYSFSDRRTATVLFVFFIVLLVVASYGIANVGLRNVPLVSAVFIFAIVLGAAFTGLGAAFPRRMVFYDWFVKISGMRSRTPEKIPYSQITKVDMIQVDGRAGYSYKVAFHVIGRPKSYEVPKAFPGGGMITADSAEAKKFADWIRSKARLPNE